MSIIESLKNLIKRVEELDKKSQKLSKEKSYSSNPFSFQQNKTYAWVERVKKIERCGHVEKRDRR